MATEGMQRGLFRGGQKKSGDVLLLIGTPGTGKRPVGHYLAQERGFVHLDFENEETRDALLDLSRSELRAELARLPEGGRGVVITWRAGGVEQLDDVDRLRAAGVEPVWFDSDRGAACSAHFADAPEPPALSLRRPVRPRGQLPPRRRRCHRAPRASARSGSASGRRGSPVTSVRVTAMRSRSSPGPRPLPLRWSWSPRAPHRSSLGRRLRVARGSAVHHVAALPHRECS